MNDFARGLRDSIIAVVLTILLMAMTVFMSGFALAGVFVCGVPMAYIGAKHKLKFTMPSVIVLFAVAFIFTMNITYALWWTFMMVLPGAVAGCMLGEKKPFFSVLLAVCATQAIGWLLSFFIINSGIEGGLGGFVDSLGPQIEANFMQSLEQIKGMGIDSELNKIAASVPEAVEMSLAMTKIYFPTAVVILAVVLGYIVLRICGFAVRVSGAADVELLPFSMLRAPRSMSIIAVLCYLLAFFATPQDTFGGVVANVASVLEFLLAICGMSFIDHLFKKVVKVTFLRWLIYAGVSVLLLVTMAFSLVSYGFVILGILDAGRDFRKIGQYQETEF